MLKWELEDFLYCLEATPILEDDGLEFHYQVTAAGLILVLVVVPHCSSVSFKIFQQGLEVPVVSFWLMVADAVSYQKDKRGEYLNFSRCKIVRDEYAGELPFSRDDQAANFNLTVELFIKPEIHLVFSCV